MFEIEKHSDLDKSFEFKSYYISMKVNYDDVNHVVVDAAIEVIKEILDKSWNETLFKQKLKDKAIQKWNENKYNLQSDYESFDEYMDLYK